MQNRAGGRIPRGFPGVAKFPAPDNIFSKLTYSGCGWVSERIERSIREAYVFAYAHRTRISILVHQGNIKNYIRTNFV